MSSNDKRFWIVPYNNENRIVEYKPPYPIIPQERRISLCNREVIVVPARAVPEASTAKKWLLTALKIACAACIIGALIAASVISFGTAAAATGGLAYLLYTNGAVCLIAAKAMTYQAWQNNMFRHTGDNGRDVRDFMNFGMLKIGRLTRNMASQRIDALIQGRDSDSKRSHRQRILDEIRNVIRYDVGRA